MKMTCKIILLCLFFGFSLVIKGYSQDINLNEVEYKIIGEGVDSPISELQVVCFNRFFNKDHLPAEFREKYNLDEKSLYKKNMLIEIFHPDKDKKGLDKIELVGIKGDDKELVIEYNLVNSNMENDEKKLSPFLILQVPKSKKEIKFIVNGTELGEPTEIYVD